MQLVRSAQSHGIGVEEEALGAVVHHVMTLHHNAVEHSIQMIAALHVMKEVTTHMIVHVQEAVVTVAGIEGMSSCLCVSVLFKKLFFIYYCLLSKLNFVI